MLTKIQIIIGFLFLMELEGFDLPFFGDYLYECESCEGFLSISCKWLGLSLVPSVFNPNFWKISLCEKRSIFDMRGLKLSQNSETDFVNRRKSCFILARVVGDNWAPSFEAPKRDVHLSRMIKRVCITLCHINGASRNLRILFLV